MAYISLPVVTVQRDFCDVIRDVDEGVLPSDRFWVSCYKTGEASVHGKVDVELDEVDRDLVRFGPKDGGVDFAMAHSVSVVQICRGTGLIWLRGTLLGADHWISLQRRWPWLPKNTVILSGHILSEWVAYLYDNGPAHVAQPQRITAFDVAPDGSRFAAGHLDGSVLIYPRLPGRGRHGIHKPDQVDSGKRKLIAKPHVSNVTSLTFFPSSRVLLSTGADFALSILSAELPGSPSPSTRIQPVRLMRGHTRSVTSACILGLGRNIISSSMDSTLRLWDVSTGDVISTIRATGPVLCMSSGARMPPPPDGEDLPSSSDETPDERETPDVAQTVIYAGLQSGSFQVFDLRAKSSTHRSPSSFTASINAISCLQSQNLLATGASHGIVTIYDVRSLASPLTLFRRNEASISDIEFVPQTTSADSEGYNVGLAIATTDGLPYIASLIPEGPGVQAELIGVDCDPVRNVRVRAGENQTLEVWTASDDAIVRRYVL